MHKQQQGESTPLSQPREAQNLDSSWVDRPSFEDAHDNTTRLGDYVLALGMQYRVGRVAAQGATVRVHLVNALGMTMVIGPHAIMRLTCAHNAPAGALCLKCNPSEPSPRQEAQGDL